jgi:hypothetical protein
MNLLNKTRVYLVGQMEYMDGSSWREFVSNSLKELGIIIFNPYNHPFINSSKEDNDARAKLDELMKEGKYDEISEIVKKIRAEDLRCVDLCDFVFVYINPKYNTCGTWEEIFWANRMKKPIFLCIEGGKDLCPKWMYGVLPHKYIYSSIEEAIDVIKKINNGEKKIDSDRFRLLREEFR